MKMDKLFLERIRNGLQRKSIVTCSQWAKKYRVMGAPLSGPWRFTHHPWLKDFHDCEAQKIVIMKNAQGGWSESVLNKSLFNIDIKGLSVLYILPSATPDAKDFSASRFGPALQLSKHIADMFSDVNNVGMKLAGNACLYVRGSRSRGSLKTVPTAIIIQDEFDEHEMSLVSLAEKRSDAQMECDKQNIKLSTPTVEDYGIHLQYQSSTQDHFFFQCPHCSKMTELIFPESLIITADDIEDPKLKESHLICKECNTKLNHESKIDWLKEGQWVSGNLASDIKGYYINQLYSMNLSPYEIATRYLLGKKDAYEEQEFYNSSIGIPHTTAGSKLSLEVVERCRGNHLCGVSNKNRIITMGVDVGHEELYIEISEYWKTTEKKSGDINSDAFCKVLYAQKITQSGIDGFRVLHAYMQKFRVRMCVVDIDPESRLALEFYNVFPSRVKLCRFTKAAQGKTIVPDDKKYIIQVDRTSWLDQSLRRFKESEIIFPQDIPVEYVEHQTALTKRYKKTKDGNTTAGYVKGKAPDHFAFARVYNEIALPLALTSGMSENIQGVV